MVSDKVVVVKVETKGLSEGLGSLSVRRADGFVRFRGSGSDVTLEKSLDNINRHDYRKVGQEIFTYNQQPKNHDKIILIEERN
jgi:hypothetical protein